MALQDGLDAFKADFKAAKRVWCPYCNIELQAIHEVLPQLHAYGVNVRCARTGWVSRC